MPLLAPNRSYRTCSGAEVFIFYLLLGHFPPKVVMIDLSLGLGEAGYPHLPLGLGEAGHPHLPLGLGEAGHPHLPLGLGEAGHPHLPLGLGEAGHHH